MKRREKRDLKKHGYSPKNIIKPNGQTLSGLIIISKGSKELHDSGYPFIRIYGIVKDALVDLGSHDHYLCYDPINVDSLGKNIFHLMLWCNKKKKLKVPKNFTPYSTFEIGNMYEKDDNFILIS